MTEEKVDVGGVRLWTTRHGVGTPILLCSGGPGCCDYLEPIAQMIDDLAQVYRWEQRGCGRSEVTGPYDQATCLADIEALRKHFGYEQWIVGGHSWGANLSLVYALEYPERVQGLIYLSGTGITQEWKPEYRRARAERGEYQPQFDYPYNPEVNRVGNRSRTEYLQNPELSSRLQMLNIPALIVHGDRDIRPSWPAAQVAELLPNADFHLMEGAEHWLWIDQAEALCEHLRTFLHEHHFC